MNPPVALVILLPAAVVARDDPRPERAIEEQIEEAERVAPRAPEAVEAFSPRAENATFPVRPGLTAGHDWIELLGDEWPGALDPPLLPERSFVNMLPGMVIPGPEGAMVFVPTDMGEETEMGPMLLLPNQELERFVTYTLGSDRRASVRLTGQIFVYDGRNYVLPTAFRAVGPAPDVSEHIENEGTPRPALVEDDPDVAELMRELERRPPPTGRLDREIDDPTGIGEDDPPSVIDGDYLAAKRGRILRAPRGAWVFRVDNDDTSTDGRGGIAYTLLPNLMLERLEVIALRSGDGVSGMMSGRVYQYQDEVFLLPTLFQEERRSGVDPLQ
jgi:hypothetical protein